MEINPAKIGALFAAVLMKANNCDFMTFDTDARYANYNPGNSTLSLAAGIQFTGNGTNFHSIFNKAAKKYDRIIILSDMQGWMPSVFGGTVPTKAYEAYRKQFNANPYIYSFDLAGFGTTQFKSDKIFCLAGFSDQVFKIMSMLETDRNALITTIENTKLK